MPAKTEIKPVKTETPTSKVETPAKVEIVPPKKEGVPTKKPDSKQETKPTEERKEEIDHFDVSQQVYEGAKKIWAFGCNFAIVKPFLKMTEGVAGKVLSVSTGLKLENVDKEIKPKLADLDNGLLNPVISKIIHMIIPVVEKGDSIIRPVITTAMRPLGLLSKAEIKDGRIDGSKKKDEGSEPETTPIRSTLEQ